MRALSQNELNSTAGGFFPNGYNINGYQIQGNQAIALTVLLALPTSYLAGELLIATGYVAMLTGKVIKLPGEILMSLLSSFNEED